MGIQVFIDGGEGTTGLRLAERLGARADIQLLKIDPDLRKDSAEKARISNTADVVFLCLPDEAAKQSVAAITNPATKIIDASTAHRTNNGWTYGLPELSALHRTAVQSARLVSNPGCHATGFSLLAYPLVSGGIAGADYPFSAVSITGYSGGGKGMIADYQNPGRDDYFNYPRHYGLAQQHKHLPEMCKVSGLPTPPVFSPVLGDFYAGMLVTIPIHTRLLNKYKSAKELHAYFNDFYAGQKLVSVLAWEGERSLPGGTLDPCSLTGKDSARLAVCGSGDCVVLSACFDNLGKGASGAAIQNMNIMCGLDEAAGLEL